MQADLQVQGFISGISDLQLMSSFRQQQAEISMYIRYGCLVRSRLIYNGIKQGLVTSSSLMIPKKE